MEIENETKIVETNDKAQNKDIKIKIICKLNSGEFGKIYMVEFIEEKTEADTPENEKIPKYGILKQCWPWSSQIPYDYIRECAFASAYRKANIPENEQLCCVPQKILLHKEHMFLLMEYLIGTVDDILLVFKHLLQNTKKLPENFSQIKFPGECERKDEEDNNDDEEKQEIDTGEIDNLEFKNNDIVHFFSAEGCESNNKLISLIEKVDIAHDDLSSSSQLTKQDISQARFNLIQEILINSYKIFTPVKNGNGNKNNNSRKKVQYEFNKKNFIQFWIEINKQSLKILNQLHSLGYYHDDYKPSNVGFKLVTSSSDSKQKFELIAIDYTHMKRLDIPCFPSEDFPCETLAPPEYFNWLNLNNNQIPTSSIAIWGHGLLTGSFLDSKLDFFPDSVLDNNKDSVLDNNKDNTDNVNEDDDEPMVDDANAKEEETIEDWFRAAMELRSLEIWIDKNGKNAESQFQQDDEADEDENENDEMVEEDEEENEDENGINCMEEDTKTQNIDLSDGNTLLCLDPLTVDFFVEEISKRRYYATLLPKWLFKWWLACFYANPVTRGVYMKDMLQRIEEKSTHNTKNAVKKVSSININDPEIKKLNDENFISKYSNSFIDLDIISWNWKLGALTQQYNNDYETFTSNCKVTQTLNADQLSLFVNEFNILFKCTESTKELSEFQWDIKKLLQAIDIYSRHPDALASLIVVERLNSQFNHVNPEEEWSNTLFDKVSRLLVQLDGDFDSSCSTYHAITSLVYKEFMKQHFAGNDVWWVPDDLKQMYQLWQEVALYLTLDIKLTPTTDQPKETSAIEIVQHAKSIAKKFINQVSSSLSNNSGTETINSITQTNNIPQSNNIPQTNNVNNNVNVVTDTAKDNILKSISSKQNLVKYRIWDTLFLQLQQPQI